jgi:hypothetical protein
LENDDPVQGGEPSTRAQVPEPSCSRSNIVCTQHKDLVAFSIAVIWFEKERRHLTLKAEILRRVRHPPPSVCSKKIYRFLYSYL